MKWAQVWGRSQACEQGPTSPVPAHIRPGGGCSHDATSALLSSCKEDSEKGKPLPNYQAIRRNLPSSFSEAFFFFASHCSHRRGEKRNPENLLSWRSWQLLVECNTVGTKKTSLISTDIDRTASSVGLLPLHVYIFLLTRSGRNLQRFVWI